MASYYTALKHKDFTIYMDNPYTIPWGFLTHGTGKNIKFNNSQYKSQLFFIASSLKIIRQQGIPRNRHNATKMLLKCRLISVIAIKSHDIRELSGKKKKKELWVKTQVQSELTCFNN